VPSNEARVDAANRIEFYLARLFCSSTRPA